MIFSVAKAQQCEGSYGDPVVKLDFGSGVNATGPPLEDGITNFFYVPDCANDGQYSIVSSQTSCHTTWHVVTHDHTGNAGGYMMLVNASETPKVFFTASKSLNLCENTNYEFSAYVLNLLTLSASVSGTVQPDLLFTIRRPDGSILEQYDTNTIPPTANPEWVKYSMPFSTGPGVTNIVLEIKNNGPGGNGNDLLLDDIEFRACGPLITPGFSTIGNTMPQNSCAGTPSNYNLVAQLGSGYTAPKVQWQQSTDGGVTWADIAGQTNLTYSFSMPANAPVGNYAYRMAAAEGDNISSLNCRTYSEPLRITQNPKPVPPVIQVAPVCDGDPVNILASGGMKYEWIGPGVTDANRNLQNFALEHASMADAGDYRVKVTTTGDCPVFSNTVHLAVNTRPVFSINSPSPICAGASTVLNVTPNGADIKSYSWQPVDGLSSPTSGTTTASPSQTTVYTVTVTNNNGCTDQKSVTVTVLPPPTIVLSPKEIIVEGQSIVLDAKPSNADTYSWTPTEGLSDPTSPNPIASPTHDITYTLTATSGIGCGTTTADVFVRVYKKIIIHTTFSPNGDGVNDTWEIEALETYPQSQLKVYNRNGQQVFSSTGYSKPWNGGYNGYVLPSGTYYYIIDLKNGSPLQSGWVYIAH
ncbi:gliding motility-associated C-terminal domain-containing protein [Mucilaginibacter celer]|nr:gliding motility-associated C-terminal domain-containing protein [Mucilaginibacter celer]